VKRAFALWLLLGCAAALAWGCNADEPGWVQAVQAAHAQADSAHGDAERAAAAEALERAYRAVPSDEDPTLTWVRQDLCVRIGDAALRRGDADAALLWAERGLGLSESSNVARADLFRVKGEALEAQGKKEDAVRALHDALEINQQLMERALTGEPPVEKRP
jgi:tetratricopeptide (TPR) repeat protein